MEFMCFIIIICLCPSVIAKKVIMLLLLQYYHANAHERCWLLLLRLNKSTWSTERKEKFHRKSSCNKMVFFILEIMCIKKGHLLWTNWINIGVRSSEMVFPILDLISFNCDADNLTNCEMTLMLLPLWLAQLKRS